MFFVSYFFYEMILSVFLFSHSSTDRDKHWGFKNESNFSICRWGNHRLFKAGARNRHLSLCSNTVHLVFKGYHGSREKWGRLKRVWALYRWRALGGSQSAKKAKSFPQGQSGQREDQNMVLPDLSLHSSTTPSLL